MNERYQLLLSDSGKLEVVDTYTTDISGFHGIATQDIKTTLGPLLKSNLSTKQEDMSEANTFFVVTNSDDTVEIVNPSNGDYVAADIQHRSHDLSAILDGYDGFQTVARAKIKAIGDKLICNSKLLNQCIPTKVNSFGVYNDEVSERCVPGWSVTSNNTNVTSRAQYNPEEQGMFMVEGTFIASQTIEGLSNATSFSMRVKGKPSIILFGGNIMTLEVDNEGFTTASWSGESVGENPILTIEISTDPVGELEVIDWSI